MSTPHFLVFVGASASLSTELGALKTRFADLEILAPAMPKNKRGLSDFAISHSIDILIQRLRSLSSHNQPARLTVWAYGPTAPESFQSLWSNYGKSAWVELIPMSLMHKDRLTRQYIEDRLVVVTKLLHEISHQVYERRNRSALPLPFGNFRSSLVTQLREHWYNESDLVALKKLIEKLCDRFRQAHSNSEHAHKDDRSLVFAPAKVEAYHGKPHPTGSSPLSFVNGRFRFGTALFPGFHYDVSAISGLLNCVLYDSEGNPRDMAPEKRDYINMFPNDHLLPQKHP